MISVAETCSHARLKVKMADSLALGEPTVPPKIKPGS
jgi:hypothetical protein